MDISLNQSPVYDYFDFINIFEQTILTMTIAIIVLEVLGLYLLLDFLTGVVHFWMDRYGREDMLWARPLLRLIPGIMRTPAV